MSMAATVMFGVVIPAYHGADSLYRSMISLAGQNFPGRLRVVVAVNDGRRDTYEKANRLRPVIEATGGECKVVKSAAGLFYALAHRQELQVSCAYHGRQTDEVDFPPQDTLAGSLKVKEAKCEREEQNDCG